MDPKLVALRLKCVEKSPCGNFSRSMKILGKGAFKIVYKGFDRASKRWIAWNQVCIDHKNLKSPTRQESLCSEAILLKSVNHRNIMKCYSYWVDDRNKKVNIITELFTSGSLRQYMKKLGFVDIQRMQNWGRQILQGLQYLHSQSPKIVHRDLKCDNIFVEVKDGETIKIGDFGLAGTMDSGPLRDLVGTPEFLAAECYEEEYDELVDIYAFGMCLLEMASLEYPYSECIYQAQIYMRVSSGVKPIALGKVKDAKVIEIIEKCLSPAYLRPSAIELLNDPFFWTETEILEMSSSLAETHL
ncbi:hypothetical protein BUALT_Bualt13G0039100 [Buddleja alternifolia]|uniref:non-specific serine/threonine protein kinase n=1 Tax=Buddleja alternifolia TaxID=168488 RepID=A0AAV6WVC4_9LAMI|nr:hypothetical protein BUALT_Bualt13G0039100 [Buddleja alternifolia]